MPTPSLLPEVLRTRKLLCDRFATSIPFAPDSLASLYSSRFSLEFASTMPVLFVRTSLPRSRLSFAWKSSIPVPFDRCATLSITWLPVTGAAWMPVSSIALPLVSSSVLRSTTLSCDGIPTAAPVSVAATRMPPPFSITRLSTTVLPSDPWIAMPCLLDRSTSLSTTRLPLERSIQMPSLLLPAIALPLITVSFVSFVSQTPWSLAKTELLRRVLPLTFDLKVGGGGGGAGSVALFCHGGRPSTMPPSWVVWTVTESTMLPVVPALSATP